MTEEEILTWAKTYAAEHGFILNPDEHKVGIVIKGLFRNTEKFGEQYCPCRIKSGDKETDRRIICPCIYHEDEIKTSGYCTCHLFFDPNKKD